MPGTSTTPIPTGDIAELAPAGGLRAQAAKLTSRANARVMFVAFLGITFVLRLPAFVVGVFNSDETFLATQAHVIEQGGQLYRDVIDRKPPLVPYLYASAFELFDTSALWSVRVVAMVAVAVTALLLAVEARRRYGIRAAWIAGLLCVFAMLAFAPQDGQAANFEVFMLPSMTAAVLLARRRRGVAAGGMVALATLAKQTGAATLLPILYLQWRSNGKKGIAGVLGGFALPLAVVALALGPSKVAYWTVLGNGSYVGVDSASATVLLMFAWMTIAWAACNLPMLWRLPKAWQDRRVLADDGRTDTDLWLWTLSAAISVAVGLRFFGHYYMQLVPPLALLAAGALSRSSWRAVKITIAAAALCAVAWSVAAYLPMWGQHPEYQSVSRYLTDNTSDTDRIVVWGSEPEIYWASGRLPGTRFPTTGTFLAGMHPGRDARAQAEDPAAARNWEWFLSDFQESRPRFVLDTSPAEVRGSEFYPISEFPQFQRIIDADYALAKTIDGVDIYERR